LETSVVGFPSIEPDPKGPTRLRDTRGRFVKRDDRSPRASATAPRSPKPPDPATATSASHEGFLATLAQVTGALVALLFAFVGAYYVFLLERGSQFEDLAAQDKVEIRRILARLREGWWMPPGFYATLPSDFDEQIRAGYPNLSDTERLSAVMNAM